jgi:lipid A 3-O-deacylase
VNNFRPVTAALAFMSASHAAMAIDGVSFEYGKSNSSNSSVNSYIVGVQWNWNKKLIEAGNWHVGGYWDLNLGYWDNQSAARTSSSIAEIGFTPVFRFQQNSITGASPYVELGVGLHFLSETSVSTERQFSSRFQFGDHIGVGVRLGDKGQHDIGYRYQHLSNADIREPNQGINFNQVRYQYHF